MRAGAIIINKDKKILLIHRFFQGREYYVIPGGGVEEGESVEEAVIREVKEETSLGAKLDKKLFEFYNEFDKRTNHFFLVTEFTGTPMLGGPEARRNGEDDKYILEWHKLSELNSINLVPKIVQEKLLTLSL